MTDLAAAHRNVRIRVRERVGEPKVEPLIDCDALPFGFERLARRVVRAWDASGVGALTIEHDLGTIVCGEAASSTTLRISRFEFARVATGRGSAEQIAACEWNAERCTDILVATPFTIRSVALVE